MPATYQILNVKEQDNQLVVEVRYEDGPSRVEARYTFAEPPPAGDLDTFLKAEGRRYLAEAKPPNPRPAPGPPVPIPPGP
jgi:hypothetical protein